MAEVSQLPYQSMDRPWRSFDEDVHDLDPLFVYEVEVWYMQICQKLIKMESKFPMIRRRK